jgi:acyl-CoA synthetase (AMP-forming)/AMP-acid ligase II
MKGPPPEPSRHANLVGALTAAAQSPHGATFVALSEREEKLSWAGLHLRARRRAAALQKLGVDPGDRVGLVLRTGPLFLESFFGVLYAGAIPVPLYPPVRLGRLDDYHEATAKMLVRVSARLCVSDGFLARLLGKSLAVARPPLGLHLASELDGNEELQYDPAPDDLALIQFSSGSTVDPKPVGLTHRQLMAHIAALTQLGAGNPRDVYVTWLPLYHDMGLIGALLTTVCYPGPMVLIPPEAFLARPALWLRALSRHQGTISAAPNFAYGLCLRRVEEAQIAGIDLRSWRVAACGAEMVSGEVMRRFVERFGPYGFRGEALLPVYGLSEASLAVTFSPPRRSPLSMIVDGPGLANGLVRPLDARTAGRTAREVVSVGKPIPGVELELRDDQGAVVPEKAVGRIFVKSPALMQGYFGDREATAEVLKEGWLDTGDLGFANAGELFIAGRAKDLVIVRGANHPPQEFEECLAGIEGLRPGCAVALGFLPAEPPAGVPGSFSEELLILAERSSEEPAANDLEARIRDAILERAGIQVHTIRLLAPGTLPRTSSGKMRRREALRRFLADELHPPKPVNAFRLIGEMAASTLALARSSFGRDG